jgi:membrane-associated phospholipid phosphatase
MRPIAIACNGLLLLSTPIDGGHYFIDVFAGIGVAALAIMAAVALTRALERRVPLSGTQTLKQPRRFVPADERAR